MVRVQGASGTSLYRGAVGVVLRLDIVQRYAHEITVRGTSTSASRARPSPIPRHADPNVVVNVVGVSRVNIHLHARRHMRAGDGGGCGRLMDLAW